MTPTRMTLGLLVLWLGLGLAASFAPTLWLTWALTPMASDVVTPTQSNKFFFMLLGINAESSINRRR